MDAGDPLTRKVIGCAIEVHRQLGPGLLESAYESCLCHELVQQGLGVERQRPLPINYKNVLVDCGYKLDLVVENALIVELKAVEAVLPIHQAQILTYLKLSGLRVGLLVNVNVRILKGGITRLVM